MTMLEERVTAVRTAYAIVKIMADDCQARATFEARCAKTLEVARFIVDEEESGEELSDFDGDPITPEVIKQMVNR